ncbi:MAG: regulator SirB, partial [Burkholderiales bacterium]|nr:regulator SirB [Burkholderiales bacterium]
MVPHAVDTLLLASAGWLMVITQQYPGVVDWLTVKLVAVVVYIGLGMVAFRFARTRSLRLA